MKYQYRRYFNAPEGHYLERITGKKDASALPRSEFYQYYRDDLTALQAVTGSIPMNQARSRPSWRTVLVKLSRQQGLPGGAEANAQAHDITKAVILAGGFGTRIPEESYLKPKNPMIEIERQAASCGTS